MLLDVSWAIGTCFFILFTVANGYLPIVLLTHDVQRTTNDECRTASGRPKQKRNEHATHRDGPHHQVVS